MSRAGVRPRCRQPRHFPRCHRAAPRPDTNPRPWRGHTRRKDTTMRTYRPLIAASLLSLALNLDLAQAQTPPAPQSAPCPAAIDKLNDALATAIIEDQKCRQTTKTASECFTHENAVATYRTEIRRLCANYSVP